jgi:DNA-binding NarL/FixJ family response regulator
LIRLVVADDHQMVRQGFRRIIEAHPDMEIVAEAAEGTELLRALEGAAADVLILDITMPGPGFLPVMDALRGRFPRLPVLVVSMHAEEQWAVQALKAGASGYLTKTHSAEELAEGVRRIHAGGRYITASLAESLARHFGPGGAMAPHDSLSRREFEVLRRLGSGRMLKTVAQEMALSPKTVTTYRKRILEKLGLQSTADLIRYAVEHDLTS